jgi:toxin CcdB
MAQFDVFRNPRPGLFPLLLDVQANLLSGLATRVVVPMAKRKGYGLPPIAQLNPRAKLGGVEYVMVFQELAAVPATALGEVVGSLKSRRAELVRAIDLLFTGI